MKILILYIIITSVFSICYVRAKAQETSSDTTSIQQFEKHNVVELYAGNYDTRFTFHNPLWKHTGFRLVANSSGYAGFYLNYKWVSVKYAWAVPNTALDSKIKLKYAALAFRFTTPNASIRPFYDAYNGLLLMRRRRHFEAFRDISIADAGVDFQYYINDKKFSHRAANLFSEKQLRPAGSLFFTALPQWNRIHYTGQQNPPNADSSTHRLLAHQPQWVSLTVGAGYQFNFIGDKGRFSISPAIAFATGGVKRIDGIHQQLRPAFSAQAWVNAGYNGSLIYTYFNAVWNYSNANLHQKNMYKTNYDICITVGYRFGNYKKKFLGLL